MTRTVNQKFELKHCFYRMGIFENFKPKYRKKNTAPKLFMNRIGEQKKTENNTNKNQPLSQ